MLAPVLISAPTLDPVTLAEAKNHLRVDSDDEDTFIEALVTAATAHLDGHSGVLGRALVTQTWRQDFDGFSDALRLPLFPVASITHVKYYDADNALQTLSSSVYSLFVDGGGAYVALAPDQEWPSSYSRVDAVAVTYVAGLAVGSVPMPIKAAILLMVGDLYANRETAQVGSVASKIPMSTTVDALISPYRRVCP
jgi:uncharacterized phiE125 gp8 family phage protein